MLNISKARTKSSKQRLPTSRNKFKICIMNSNKNALTTNHKINLKIESIRIRVKTSYKINHRCHWWEGCTNVCSSTQGILKQSLLLSHRFVEKLHLFKKQCSVCLKTDLWTESKVMSYLKIDLGNECCQGFSLRSHLFIQRESISSSSYLRRLVLKNVLVDES